MNARVLFGLLFRPSVVIALLAVALATGIVCWVEHALGSAIPRPFFSFLYNVVALLLLGSLATFLGRAMTELQGVRLSRVIPGLRRQANLGVLLAVPLATALATVFVYWRLPQQGAVVHPVTYWAAAMAFMSVQLTLANSWIAAVLSALLGSKVTALIGIFRTHPNEVTIGAIALTLIALAISRARYFPRAGSVWEKWQHSRWFSSPFAPKAKTRRSGAGLPDRPAPKFAASGVTLAKLAQAGVYERFGHARGRMLGRTLLWIGVIYGIFLAFAWQSLPSGHRNAEALAQQLFLSEGNRVDASQVLRWLFAAITGLVAYVAALVLDASPRPEVWHPVSRMLKGRVAFFSRVRQNLMFAGIHFAVMALVFAIVAQRLGRWPYAGTMMAYLSPSLVVAMIMLIPQALFPRGAETFQRKTNVLVQLGAGLLGGALCLLCVYWSSHWPFAPLDATVPLRTRVIWLLLATLAAYRGYFLLMRRHYARADLRVREA